VGPSSSVGEAKKREITCLCLESYLLSCSPYPVTSPTELSLNHCLLSLINQYLLSSAQPVSFHSTSSAVGFPITEMQPRTFSYSCHFKLILSAIL
jgi:hypothetical protein